MANVKIKDAELIGEVSEEIMIPVGNTGDESVPQAVKVSQLIEKTVEGLATVATSGSYNDLSNKPTFKTVNNQSILGTGNISIEGGSSKIVPVAPTLDLSEPDADVADAYNSPSEYLLLGKQSDGSSLVYEFYYQYDGFQLWRTYKHYGYTSSAQYATDMIKLKVLPDGSYVSWGASASTYVHNNTITIKQGETEQTFTLNQSSNKTITIDAVPTKTSELSNDSDYTTKAYVDGLVGSINTIMETIIQG